VKYINKCSTVTRPVPLMEQELITPQSHPNRPTLFSDVRVAQSLYFLCSAWYLPTFLILKVWV